MGRKGLSDFDKEKDEWYYQPKIYVDRQDTDSTYSELKEFRLRASKGVEEELMDDRMLDELSKKEPGNSVKRLKESPGERQFKGSPVEMQEADETGGFFDGQTQLLKEEIEDINRNLEKRAKIEKESGDSIDFEIKEVKRHLHEIYTWKKGDKSTIEFIRRYFLAWHLFPFHSHLLKIPLLFFSLFLFLFDPSFFTSFSCHQDTKAPRYITLFLDVVP